MKVLFITPYPHDEAPSQRFRFEQYYRYLKKKKVTIDTAPFIDLSTWQILYKEKKWFKKGWGILKGFLKRWLLLFSLKKYDVLFIHREMAPLGPPLFEWITKSMFKGKIIYDFDDAIWLSNTSEVNHLVRWLKWHSKVKHICRWSSKVSCGNDFLCSYAKRYNENVFYNPTVVDTKKYHNKLKDQSSGKNSITIGWTGTHSTTPYLKLLNPVVKEINKKFDAEWKIIANRKPELNWNQVTFIKWDKATEIDDLLGLNIGLMPMPDSPWTKGKCGFKVLQYMSLGIVPVASPVGVNQKIIAHGKDGYLCHETQTWIDCLKKLIESPELRKKMGEQARQKVENQYSVHICWDNFWRLFA